MRITSHTTLLVGDAKTAEYVIPGTVVELDDDEAGKLIARGLAVKAAKPETKPADKETPPKDNVGGGASKAGNAQ